MQYGFPYHTLDEVYQEAEKTPWDCPGRAGWRRWAGG